MVRKLAIAAFTVSALSAGVAKALGLGEATVNSSLNQPLNAEIQLVNLRGLGESEIFAELASREEFQRAGVDRVYFLSDLRFKVDNSSGRPVIRVTSSRPVREPFINFLVEVNWPSGRLLREYAILIDPPTYSVEPAEAVRPAPVTDASSPSRQVGTQSPAITQAPESPSSQPVGSQVSEPPPSQVQPASAQEYGPTSRSDTLWSIAQQTRPDSSVSPQQMMLAIQDLNPDAFFDNNINRLKSGQILRLPDQGAINARSRGEAIQQVTAQNRSFEDRAQPRTRTIGATSQLEQTETPASQPESQDRLRVVVDSSTANQNGTPSVSGSTPEGTGQAASSDINTVKEELDRSTRENQELQGRVEDLEDQLATLQRLLELKDNELAALQADVAAEDDQSAVSELDGETGGSEAEPDQATETAEDAISADTDSDAESAVEPIAGEQIADDAQVDGDSSIPPEAGEAQDAEDTGLESDQPPPIADDTGSDVSAGQSEIAETGTMMGTEGESTDPAMQDDDQLAPVQPTLSPDGEGMSTTEPSVVTTPQPVETSQDTSLLSKFKNNPVYQIGLGAVALIIALILWMLSRHNARKEEDYYAKAVDEGDAEAVIHIDDSDDTQVPLDEADGESDPVEEADVYLAYQKYDQAEAVLDSALEKEPHNNRYRLKLMEVAGEAGNAAKFIALAAAIESSGDTAASTQANEIKARYPSMDEEPSISLDDLESQLMAGGGVSTASGTFASEDELEESTLSEDFDLDVDVNDSAEVNEAIAASEAEADFVQNEKIDLEKESLVEGEDDLDIDFDIGEIDLDDTESAEDYGTVEYEKPDLPATEGSAPSDETVAGDTLLDEELGEEDFTLDTEIEEDFGLGITEESPTDETLVDSSQLTDAISEDDSLIEQSLEDDMTLVSSELDDALLDLDSGDEASSEASVTEEEDFNFELDDSEIDLALDEFDADQPSDELTANDEIADFELDSETLPDHAENELSEDIAENFLDQVEEEPSTTLSEADKGLFEEEPGFAEDSLDDLALDEAESASAEDAETSGSVIEEAMSQGALGDELDSSEDMLLDETLLDEDLESFNFSEEESALETESDAIEDELELVDEADASSAESVEETVVAESDALDGAESDEFLEEMEDDFEFLSDTDEAATKLDLARAYVDMGDKEGAKDILEEVVNEGSDEQKKEAQDLIKGLD